MEILATGEKIRRARIYKGLTLKDLCGDKLSVSKLSCIENDKIQAETETLIYIAEKLGISYDYLTESIKGQIEKNVRLLEHKQNIKDYEEVLDYNLKYAIDNEYYDLAFEIMHILFSYYLDQEKKQKIQMITSSYYDIFNKSSKESNYLIYNQDMGRYFYASKEYSQAVTYYSSIRTGLIEKGSKDSSELASIIYDEITCYISMGDYNNAFELAKQLETLIENVQERSKKGQMYHIIAILALRTDKNKFELLEQKTYETYGEDTANKCRAIFDFGCCMFNLDMRDTAISYIQKGLLLYPKDDKVGNVKFIVGCLGTLLENNLLDMAQEICDDASNIAIMLDDLRLIEKTYYYKAMILQKQGNYMSAEMYMNLSTDALFKCGDKYERYARYLEMGNMYHKLGQINDSIKYLSLAMLLEKKL